MSDQRAGGIAWTDETWNPVRGCTRVSPGCENCYAERTAARFAGPGLPYEGLARIGKGGPRWTGEVRMVPEHLADPLRWKRPRRIFVNSMSDLFHEKLTNEQIAAVFGVMSAAPQHTFQVLTKRPGRMLDWFEWVDREGAKTVPPEHPWWRALRCQESARKLLVPRVKAAGTYGVGLRGGGEATWPLENVWLGVTAEDQQRADERVPLLLQTPAAVRFVSVEPQLGLVDLTKVRTAGGLVAIDSVGGLGPRNVVPRQYLVSRLDWVITGAESGPGARPYDLAWARSLRDQCAAAGVAFFLKQVIDGGKKVSTPPLDGVVHAEFPR